MRKYGKWDAFRFRLKPDGLGSLGTSKHGCENPRRDAKTCKTLRAAMGGDPSRRCGRGGETGGDLEPEGTPIGLFFGSKSKHSAGEKKAGGGITRAGWPSPSSPFGVEGGQGSIGRAGEGRRGS